MKRSDELMRENEALRERLSRLSEASLHIADLDLDAVLQGVADGARLLTGAIRGGITVIDDSGELQDFISSGMTDEEHQRFLALAGGMELFAYLSNLPEPLRLSDFSAYATALALPEIGPPLGPVGSFLCTPIRLGGARVGNLYLADKQEAEEFTQEDEETLVLFASHAAMAIANARRHREEQRAKSDLETLIDTSPVGVAVFDMRKGAAASFNREGRRIVDELRNPDQPAEDLLRLMTVRRADGREVSLMEFPLAEVLGSSETVRAEEIVLGVPDGRSVTVLLNATPIRSGEGEVESVVVTMQDMTAVEEAERLRAEFLAMVSHELRMPLTSIRGAATSLLDAAEDLDPAETHQFHRIIVDRADHMRDLIGDLLDVARIETGALPVEPEPVEVEALVDRARNAFTSAGGRIDLAIDVAPGLPPVMADRRRIVQVIGNLLSNAARHSSESSIIRVTAVREDLHVVVSVADEGRGIPAASLPHLFRKFSRIQSDEQGGDTGLGLAICKGIVEAHGGRIWAESSGPGLGARFAFTLPTVEEAVDGTASSPPVSNRSSQRKQREAAERVRILAVDDDPQTLRYVRHTLTKAGYAPIVTGNPEEAIRHMEEERPQLALLDLMLPGTDGIELMKEMLEVADVPIIFLSAYGRDELIVKAFDMGAVDYVVKPFSPTELAARIRAALRSRAMSEPSEPYVLGDLTIDYTERKVTLSGRTVELVAMEYRMLAELSANGGRVMTYSQLLQRVWGAKEHGDLRPMRTIVSKLRRKLGEDAGNPTYIFTEPRIGYRMRKGDQVLSRRQPG